MIVIKNEREIRAMREACAVASEVLDAVCGFVTPGVTTRDIDQFAADRIAIYGAKSAFLGYRGYPCHMCISVNEQVVHGLSGTRRIQFGDILSLDVGVVLNGFIGDNARTVPAGACDIEAQKLIDVTEKALYEGISKAVAGNRVRDISSAIQTLVEANGMSVVREFVGHGVGRSMHEEPQIPNYVDGTSSPKLRAGMTLAIEPMVNLGRAGVEILKDGWTVVTRDRKPSAHFEHTVLVNDGSPEILTCRCVKPSALKVSS